jgi:hypothetical protein
MEFDELAKVWREEESSEIRRTRVESLSDLRGRATQIEKNTRHRFRRATIVWLVLVPWFAFWAYVGIRRGSPLVTIGCIIMVVGCIAPAVFLRRMGAAKVDLTLPVRVAVAKEVERVRDLQRVIRRMIEWVAGSLMVGAPLFIAGASSSPTRIPLIALVILVGIASRRGWRRFADRLNATSEELESWIPDLERL